MGTTGANCAHPWETLVFHEVVHIQGLTIMLAASLVREPDKMQEDMSNVSRDKNLKKEPRKKILGIKATATEMKNASDGHVSARKLTSWT